MTPQGQTPVCQTLTSRRTAHRAMTLIELLIVLGIISIVAALLLPVFARVREHALKTVCVSNIHQAILALSIYREDNDGGFPAYPAPPGSGTHDFGGEYKLKFGFCKGALDNTPAWSETLFPYLKPPSAASSSTVVNETSPDVLYCPADRAARRAYASSDPQLPERHPTSYELKYWLALGRTEAEVPIPSHMALLWEQKDYHNGGHNGGSSREMEGNVGFVDGHIKWLRFSQTTRALAGETPDLGAYCDDDDGADF